MATGSSGELATAVEALYSAGLGQGAWDAALARMTGFVGGEGTVSFLLDRRDGRILDFTEQGLQSGRDDYVARMHRINPRARYSLAQAGPHVTWDYRFLEEPDIRRHEFYDWLERTVGTRYFIGARVFDDGDRSVLASVEFTARQGHPQKEHVGRFRRLLPHVANAWRLRLLLARTQAQAELTGALQGLLPWGLAALGREGRVVFMNEQAEAALGRDDGLKVAGGRLSAAHAAADRSLQRLIGEAVRQAEPQSPPAGGSLAVARPSGAAPILLRVVPLPGSAEGGLGQSVRALVLVDDPAAGCEPQVESAAALFGLSPREAAVSLLLYRGYSLPAAADAMGITHNTARAHLRGIFVKTGTHSQAQLLRLIGRIWPA